jgi:EAL domain-containing protein (putative c-di-GMP-specific phosphodiesterase class I)
MDELPSDAAPTAHALVCAARDHLGMDLAFVAEFSGGRRVFRFTDSAPGALRLEAGTSDPLADTYCEQIVNGTIPAVIPDASVEPSVRELAVTDRLGIAAYVGVPVRHSDGRLYGTLCVVSHVTRDDLDDGARRYLAVMAEAIAADVERSAHAPAEQGERRRRIEHVLATPGSFHTVYQPIVDLTTGAVVGAEALTRFPDDGRGPIAWFAEAATVGLGVELELAAARTALDGFDDRDRFLALNVSPPALEPVVDLLAGDRRWHGHVVVELTEHTEIAEYELLRGLTRRLHEVGSQLAVDDTGAGVASLRHILELRPDIIKLDLSLTIGIDHDPVRQALAEALASFAERIDADVIAEGIETAEQLAAVASLGIRLGQGYHLGRPGPWPPVLSDWPGSGA